MEFLLFYAVVFSTLVIQGVCGFGGTLLAMPFGILLLGTARAKAILSMATLIGSLLPAIQYRKSICWREALKIIAVMLLGALAAQLIPREPPDWILLCYGGFIIAVAARNLFARKTISLSEPASLLVLSLAGLIHGAFMSGGSLLAIYAMDRMKDKDVFRATLSFVWLVLNSTVLFFSALGGQYQPDILRASLIAMLPAFLGVTLGGFLQKRMEAERFMTVTNCLLVISAIILMRNCLSA